MELEERFWSKVDKGKPDECWEWQAARDRGYGRIKTKRGTRLATRISVKLDGRSPKNQNVLHKCDNPPCVNPNHLYLGNQQDNMQDAVERERVNFGEDGSNAKLTKKEVQEINDKMHEGLSNSEIAEEYDITKTTVSDIRCGNSWTHVDIENPYRETYDPVANKDKLSDKDVKQIKARLEAGEVTKRLAEDFDVSNSVIVRIKNDERYDNINPTQEMIQKAEVKGYKGNKLDESKVKSIKQMLENTDITHKEIAEIFGVSPTLISQIGSGKRWSRVEV